jgi:hypothetical protein
VGTVTVEQAIGGMRGIPVRSVVLCPCAPRALAAFCGRRRRYAPPPALPLTPLLAPACRLVQSMLWETSLLDADEGIRFRGHSIPDLQASLPAAQEGGEPLPEGMLWLLLTGDVSPGPRTALSGCSARTRASAKP